MKQNFSQKLLRFIIVVLCISCSSNGYAQKTFTVICDKTDNTVKVVESEVKSPNFIPIKGGFPFRQVAQKWIDQNYTTTQCNPGEIIDQIKTQSQPKNAPPQQNNATPPQQNKPASGNSNQQTQSTQAPEKFNNTSLLLDIKFANLGKTLMLKNNLVPGIELGVEQLIGKEIYVGTGILFNAYYATIDQGGENSQFYYFGRIPAFLGYRTKTSGMVFMGEAGVQVNTKMVSTEDDRSVMGRTGTNNSVNLLGRLKMGSETVMFELGTELWLTKLFENYEDFNMTSIYLGLRFYF